MRWPGLGLLETIRCVASYGRARVFPTKPEEDFATWITNRFGKRLFEIFFKTYTEKVWGIPCTQIDAEWAAQRIKGLSLTTAVKNALFGERGKSKEEIVKTLIGEFLYPRHGPGMMWERTREIVESMGSQVVFDAPLERIVWSEGRVETVHAAGVAYPAEHIISSVAIRELVESFEPPPPEDVLSAARKLRYRDFLTVALVIQRDGLFPDNWIYIHEPSVKMGRVQNYGNWSSEMVADPKTSCLGLEYFCLEGDELWSSSNRQLIDLGKRELAALGLADPDDVIDAAVVRMKKVYPVYDRGYAAAVAKVRAFLATLPNLQLVGRNGMHRYNNQDHSMLTAMLAARNILGGRYDLWRVNVDEEYHEEGREISLEDLRSLEATQPLVPHRIDQ